jgi:hypothetical protein
MGQRKRLRNDINLSELCFVARELMEKIIKHFEIDYVLKIHFNQSDKKLRLSEAVVNTVQEFLKTKPNCVVNKFEQENNIDRMFIFCENETQFDIVMSLTEKEKSNIGEMVYDEKSIRKVVDDDSYTVFDKTTKDKTFSDKSGVIKDSLLIKLNSFE